MRDNIDPTLTFLVIIMIHWKSLFLEKSQILIKISYHLCTKVRIVQISVNLLFSILHVRGFLKHLWHRKTMTFQFNQHLFAGWYESTPKTMIWFFFLYNVYTKQNLSLFPCKSTIFSPQLSHFLSVSHVEHHISLRRVTS